VLSWSDNMFDSSIFRFLIGAVIVYVAFVAMLTLLQRRLIYFPDTSRIVPASTGISGLNALELVAADGVRLVAWYRAARPGQPTVLYLHGNAGNIAYRVSKARPFLDAGMGVMLLSWRGYGGSDGSPSEQGLYADGRAAAAELDRLGVTPSLLALYGESLGAGVAVQLASERPVAAIVLEAPFTSAVDIGASTYPFVPVRWLMWDRFDSASKIERIGAPLLIMHGEHDEVVPVSHGRRLFEMARTPKELVTFPRGYHNDLDSHGAMRRAVEFIAAAVNKRT